MAVTLGDVIVWIKPDDSKLDNGLKQAEKKTKGWASKLGGTTAKLVGGAVVAGAAAATGAIVGIGAAALSTGSQIRQGQNDIQASLGVTEDRAKELGQVAIEVFKDNFAGSIEEANAAVIEARKQLGDLSDTELRDATENAFRLSDVFGVDISESLNAANTLMQDFGLTQQQAFDFLATGFQRGLDSSGDFIDTITEYSTQFANAGADADQFFSLMESGLQGGMLGTDRAADAFKEFRVRIQDGSKTTSEALEMIGINADDLAARMADGSVTATDAFQMVIEKLQGVDDENIRMQAGVGLLGTQFEDLGTEAALALDLTGTKMEDLAGATEKLDKKYDNLGAVIEGLKRRALIAIAPIGDKLLDLANQAMPYVEQGIDKLALILEGVLGDVVDFLVTTAIPTLRTFGEWFISEGWPAIQAFAQPILQQLIPGLVQLATWAMEIGSVLLPILGDAIQFVTDNFNIIGPVLGVVAGLILALSSPITLVIGAIVLLATAWANNWGGIQEKTQAVLDFIIPKIQVAMALISSVVSSVLGYINNWWEKHGDSVITVVTFLWNTVKALFTVALNFLKNTIQVWITLIQQFWQRWGDTIVEIARLAWDSIKTIITTALDIIGYIIDAAAALIRGDWEAFGQALQNIWQTAWDGIATIVTNAKDAILLVIAGIIQDIKDSFDIDWAGLGEKIVSGIKQGLKDNWDALIDWFEDKIDDFWDAVADFFGIGSPSRIAMDIGRQIQAGLALGLAEGQGMPVRAMAQTTTSIINNFYQTINTTRLGNAAGEFQQMRALIST